MKWLKYLLLALCLPGLALADTIIADTNGDGTPDTITTQPARIDILHGGSGVLSTYFINPTPYAVYAVTDTNGLAGDEIVILQDNVLIVIDDAKRQRRDYSVGPSFSFHFTANTDGRPGQEIVGSVIAPLQGPCQPISVSGPCVLIIDDARAQLRYYDVNFRIIGDIRTPGWVTLVDVLGHADTDGVAGEEIVVRRNDNVVLVVSDVLHGTRVHNIGQLFQFGGIADTNGSGGNEIVLTSNDFRIQIIDETNGGAIRTYSAGGAFQISSMQDLDAAPGTEVCFRTTATLPNVFWVIVDRVQNKFLSTDKNGCALPSASPPPPPPPPPPASGWGTATMIGGSSTTTISPQIASDANGNAIAVWDQADATRYNVWASRYAAGSGWGTPTLIQTNAYTPQIVSDATGNALAVWSTDSGAIWANGYTAGSGWGVPTPIQTSPGWADSPQIAIDATGNATAVWNQDMTIWANRYTSGSGWGAATRIQTNAGPADSPQIAMDANGNAIAVWNQYSPQYNLWANVYTAGSGWGTATPINRGTQNPRIAMDANGNAIAVSPAGSVRYTAGIGWGAAIPFETNGGSAVFTQIAMDAIGNAIAVWQQSDGTRYNVRANVYTAGSGWGAATLIETNAGSAGSPQIAMDANGNAFAVWSQTDGTRYNIWANRYTAGGGWRAAELIETDNAGNAFAPQIKLDGSGSGTAIAVWGQSNGTRYNVWVNRFTP